jgi:hypothetical protein
MRLKLKTASKYILYIYIYNKGLNTIHSPKVVTRFQSCLQSLKICNVPQRSFSIFQYRNSVKPNEKCITYVAHDFFNANLPFPFGLTEKATGITTLKN